MPVTIGQGFTRCPSPDPADLIGYPSQALFERRIGQAGEGQAKLFVQADSPGPHDPAGDPGNTLSRPARRD